MAKAATKKAATIEVEEPRSVLTTTDPAFLSGLGDELAGFEGAGTSQLAEDNLIPIVTLLQDLSPQTKERNPEYVNGARPGDFLIKSLGVLINGDDGFWFQPVHFSHMWNEWVPRDSGGGLVGMYPEKPDDAKEVLNDKGKKVWRSARGNDYVETRYFAGFLKTPEGQIFPAVLPFSSTGHSVAKAWMVQMNQVIINGRIAPAWFKAYKFKSRIKAKNNQEWFLPEITESIWVEERANRDKGKDLYLSFEAGDKKIEKDTSTENNDTNIPF